MRTLIEIELDTATANQAITDGTLETSMGKMLEALKPEAAYFFPRMGRRCALLVVDLPDEAAIVPTAEPAWLALNADVTMTPCMNADELRAGLARLGR
ncbi:hypothetical protein [Kitasatospora sp. MAP5-34]|uniref:hypothetical protein n=1 Tax=Kitasatospora sp. MAP5-34 TaxID=3035102 RepID=UPI002473D57A|nr:hypothetical protein [Kitasatospora sp. MAP5-34]MDH6575203.1 hypothetical protein [Kitasatospora sp. MAP5-34]